VKLNPLYFLGMSRVGCMPCINCRKDELLEISKRFPKYIDIKREWESLVSMASKRWMEYVLC
jgi:3'-phosphoadenosine 5'-phosphosulfate sulfotransferase (PAPS reductase)/FAD synthetase